MSRKTHDAARPHGHDRKDGFNPVPSPDPPADAPEAEAGMEFTRTRQPDAPPAADAPEAIDDRAESAKATAKAKEQPLFKFQVRNTYVQGDGAIRAGSLEEAEEAVRGFLTAGLTVREA